MKKLFRFTLGTRIFLVTAALVALAVTAAVVVTSIVGERIARRAVVRALDRSASVQTSFQAQRQGQLRLIARLLASDANLRAYLAEAIDGGELRSLLDALEDRRADLGSDFVMLIDTEGTVLANTARPDDVGISLENDPLFETAYERFEAGGVWERDGRLYNAVAVPLRQGAFLSGFMIAGFGIDDVSAREIRRVSDTDVAILAGSSSSPRVVATTLGAEQGALMSALRAHGVALVRSLEQGQTVEQVELSLGERRSIAQLRPLMDPAGNAIGATVAIASLDEAIAPYRQISATLLGVGAAAVVLASLLSWLVSRRVMKPVRALADAATAASKGDYERRFATGSSDEVGQLATALDSLLSDLREKRDMESYVADLARTIPDSGGAALERGETRRVAMLGLELRSYARSRSTADPIETMERLAQDLRRIETMVRRQKGQLVAVAGHRILAAFEGDAAAYRAFSAATDVLSALSARRSAFDEEEPPAAALALGDVVHGGVLVGDTSRTTFVGLPVQQLESLMREATPGDLMLSPPVYDELASTFGRSGVELSPQRGIVSPQRFYLLTSDQVTRLASGVQHGATTALGPGLEPQRLTAANSVGTLSEVVPGSLLGERFEIVSTLGAGGMGVVYKVRDRELDDLVALKMLRSDVWGDRDQLERLKSELKLARKITHPNVLRTFDFGEVDGIPFITMEYVRGITLRYLLDENQRLPFSAALRISRQLCRGLEAAHAQGVIHRDIKPENMIIEPNGNAKLMDFGIARPVKRMTPGQTTPGTVIGTPHYLSPEQLEGREPDERADIYAVGVVLYELFAGRLPFTGDTPMQIVIKHLQEAPAPPSTLWPEIPPNLEKVVLKCLEKNPEKRYRRIEQVVVELDGMRA